MENEYSAGIVIYNNGRYLLLNYGRSWHSPDRWGFTKGHIEKNETILETAIREAREETGLSEIQIIEGFEHRVTYYFNRGNNKVKKTVVYLIGTTSCKDVRISNEHIGYCWATYNVALNMLSFENTRRILRAAENYLKKLNLTVTPTEELKDGID